MASKHKEKSAWVLDTPEADYEETNAGSVPTAKRTINIEDPPGYQEMQARFRVLGRNLIRCRCIDGRVSYGVERAGALTRHYTTLGELQAYLGRLRRRATP